MKKFIGIAFVVMLVAGTIAVEFDKDMRACIKSFEGEVEVIAGMEAEVNQYNPAVPSSRPSKETVLAVKNPDFPFNGRLDKVLAQRQALLRGKGIFMLGTWHTAIKAGMRESITASLYIPYKPWKLRYS